MAKQRFYFHCTVTGCRKRCTRVGESEATFGSPPSPEWLVYKCPDHGYHVWNVEKNLLYGYGSPDSDLEHIKGRIKIKWKWLQP